MKQIVILVALLLMAGGLFSQEVFKLGMVKGKYVTYQVRVSKRPLKNWLVRNVHNPDTVVKPIPWRYGITMQEIDIETQIAKIMHGHFSQEELQILEKKDETFSLILRVNRNNYKLLQVTCFLFDNRYYRGLQCTPEEREQWHYPKTYDGFWLNLDPDRLYEIEKDIVKRVVLPKGMHKSYLEDDIWIVMGTKSIANLEKTRLKQQKTLADSLLRRLGVEQTKIERQEAIFGKEYKEDEEIEICGPPHEL